MINKQRRKELGALKYKKRIKAIVGSLSVYIKGNGEDVFHPKAIDIIRDNGYLIYKSSSTLCSCWMCSGRDKYKRHEQKRVNRKLIVEG